MSYWNSTDEYLTKHGGEAPKCPRCGKEMFAADDHGRFSCLCQGLVTFDAIASVELSPPLPILQVDTSEMTNAQKARVAPIHRLNAAPTTAEAAYFALMAKGPEALDDPEYARVCAELDKERQQAGR